MSSLSRQTRARSSSMLEPSAPTGWAVRAIASFVRALATPSWHSMIFFLGFGGLARGILTASGLGSRPTASTLVYAACLPLALVTGAAIDSSQIKDSQAPRVLSALLGSLGFLLATLTSRGDLFGPISLMVCMYGIVIAPRLVQRLRRRSGQHRAGVVGQRAGVAGEIWRPAAQLARSER